MHDPASTCAPQFYTSAAALVVQMPYMLYAHGGELFGWAQLGLDPNLRLATRNL